MSSPTSLSARVAISVFHSHRRPAVTLPGRPSSPAPIPQPRPTPRRLTDGQLDIVMRAAAPLAPSDRRLFLRAVADALQDVAELGDGLVSDVEGTCKQLQRLTSISRATALARRAHLLYIRRIENEREHQRILIAQKSWGGHHESHVACECLSRA